MHGIKSCMWASSGRRCLGFPGFFLLPGASELCCSMAPLKGTFIMDYLPPPNTRAVQIESTQAALFLSR